MARDALKRAKEEILSNAPERLKFAALELRMAMESLTYDRAQSYKEEIHPDEYDTWQPRKLLQLLLEIDPSADKDSSISYGVEDEPGKEAKHMQSLGKEKVLNLGTIKRHYDALGAYLHIPTLKQIDEGATHNLIKLRKRCEQIAEELESTLASSIWNINFGNFAEIACMRCNSPIRKRLPSGVPRTNATCFQCNATYTISEAEPGKTLWHPLRKEVICASDDCKCKFFIWDGDLKPYSQVRCPNCGKTHFIDLCIHT